MLRLIRGLQNIRKTDQQSIATIGCFDGVHCGHQGLIAQVVKEAERKSTLSLLITFEPHPREFFAKENPPSRLTCLREKLDILKELKLNRVLVLRFNHSMAQLTADDFIKIILVEKLAIQQLWVGDNFRFGKDKKGNIHLLRKAGEKFGFTINTVPPLSYEKKRVSSSRIRQALATAHFSLSAQLLGRPYWIGGRVIHGHHLGKKLGFPTANIAVMRKTVPLNGIFIVKVHGLAKSALNAVASMGTRPSISTPFNNPKIVLEVHVLDFNKNIYGQFIKVEFLSKIRDEQYFASLDLLKQHISNDVAMARAFFTKIKKPL